jgi:integrase
MPKAKRDPVNLTQFKVDSLKKDPAGEYEQGDTQVPGFAVRVRPSGAKSYVLSKRLPGERTRTRVTIGKVGEIELEKARERARDAIGEIKQGVEVNVEKRRQVAQATAERARSRKAEAETGYPPRSFGETAIRYITLECPVLRRGSEIERIIRRDLLPAWGVTSIDTLRRADLTALLDPILAAGKTQAAHKLREIAIRVINWAIDRGDMEINFLASPSRGRKKTGTMKRTRRERTLSDAEIRAVWCAALATPYPFGPLVRLTMMLGQRREEIAGMTWAEIDMDASTWTIPKERYKTGIEHLVPLPKQALDLLEEIAPLSPKPDDPVAIHFVFSTKPGSRFQGFTKCKTRLDTLSETTDWTIHDLRRTLRTGLSSLRIVPDVAERVIGHVIGGVRGVYDRYAFLDEKRDALGLWADRIEAIVKASPPSKATPMKPNVVTLLPRRA